MKIGVKSGDSTPAGKKIGVKHLPPDTSGPTGEAIAQNAETQYGTSRYFYGGEGPVPSSLTVGSPKYKPPGNEGGMS